MSSHAISDSVLTEQRLFEPPKISGLKPTSNQGRIRPLYKRPPNTRRVLGEIAHELHWFSPGIASRLEPSLRSVVCRRELNLSYNCWTVTSHLAQKQSGHSLGRRPGDSELTYQQAAARSLQMRERAQIPWREEGRSRRNLHGHGCRTPHRVAACARIGAPQP